MSGMFYHSVATVFNSDLSRWKTAQVTDMSGMFAGAVTFNRDLSSWETGQVTDMRFMFALASVFDADITGWNTAQLTQTPANMFEDADAWLATYERIDGSATTAGPPNRWKIK
jgi:surface protein